MATSTCHFLSFKALGQESNWHQCKVDGSQVVLPFIQVYQLTSGFQSLIHTGISLAGMGLAMP